ncbi:hypothetical protein ES703_100349 [subsurface metagenome]
MVKRTKVWLVCSRCGKRMSGATRAEALNKMRKHLWKEHREWMVSRIKAGQRKAKKVKSSGSLHGHVLLGSGLDITENPAWIPLLLAGLATVSEIASLYAQFSKKPAAERLATRTKIASDALSHIRAVT